MSNEFITTDTYGTDHPEVDDDIVRYVKAEHKRLMTERLMVEDTWREAWMLYLGTPIAVTDQRNHTIKTVGNVNSDWRHRISTGKCYESVETIHGYLMSATFPNNEWFNVEPEQPGYAEVARVIRKYVANKLEAANFRSHYEQFLRQLLVCGTSVMALPWRYEAIKWKKNIKNRVPVMDEFTLDIDKRTHWEVQEQTKVVMNRPEFETLDMFECFLEPRAKDSNDCTFIRRILKTKAEVINLIEQGFYTGVSPTDVVTTLPYTQSDSNQDSVRIAQGVTPPPPPNLLDQVMILEYWGNINLSGVTYHDVVATVMGDYLLRFETNPYWCGKPFIVGTCTPLTQTPYAIGVVQPAMGMLHELNIITNQRLDSLEISIDSMFTLKSDGVLAPDDVYSEPGRVFLVGDHTDLQPVELPQQWNVTYEETEVLEKFIDKAFGTGSMVSVGEGRSGERVTAAEIQALRDAGGNRLSNLHKHIEDTSLLPILKKVFRLMQQFVTEDEVVRVAGDQTGSYAYYKVDANTLNMDYSLKPIGADYVTDRENYIQSRMQFLQAVAGIPQMANSINYHKILYDLVQHFGFDDPESYIMQAQPVPPEGGVPSQSSSQPPLNGQGPSPTSPLTSSAQPTTGGTPPSMPSSDGSNGSTEAAMQMLNGANSPQLAALLADRHVRTGLTNQLMADRGRKLAKKATGIDIGPYLNLQDQQVPPPQ